MSLFQRDASMNMKARRLWAWQIAAWGLVFCAAALAGEPAGLKSPADPSCSAANGGACQNGACRGCGPTCCPDDYCCKTPPCITLPATCGGCNDYCCKKPPCITLPATCGGCDDYACKTPPCIRLPGCYPSYYRCPPPLCKPAEPGCAASCGVAPGVASGAYAVGPPAPPPKRGPDPLPAKPQPRLAWLRSLWSE
jgi:hypothetical protein